jgi:hypothetical protein
MVFAAAICIDSQLFYCPIQVTSLTKYLDMFSPFNQCAYVLDIKSIFTFSFRNRLRLLTILISYQGGKPDSAIPFHFWFGMFSFE